MRAYELIESQDTIPHYLHTSCSLYIQEMHQQVEIANRVLNDERYGESFLQSYVRKSNWLYAHFFSRRSSGNVQMLFSLLASEFIKTEPTIAKISKDILSVEAESSTTRSKLFDKIGKALLSIVTIMLEKNIYPQNKATLENLRSGLYRSLTKFENLYRQFVDRKTAERTGVDIVEPEIKVVDPVNQQRARAEEMFNQILSGLPSAVAGDLRNKSRRIDTTDKLQWLMSELKKLGIK